MSDKVWDVFHSIVGIPLKSGRQVVGVIGLAHVEEEGEKFTEKNVTVLSRFAELASIALDNARLYEDIRRELAERKRVEEALRESEERYRTITENTNEAILVAQDGVFRFANPKAEELFGYSKEELASRPFADFIHEADRGMVGDRHERRVRGEELPATYPYRIVDKSGHTKWIELNVALFSWAERPATLCFMMDITNRKGMEEALRESEEKYRISLQSIPDSVSINRQKDGLFFYANEGFSQIMGYSVEEVEGKTSLDLNLFVNPADRDEVIKILEEKGELHGFELEYRKKDGTIFDALLSVRPLQYGEEDCLVAVVKDITLIKKAEQEKAKLRAQLQHAQRMESIGTLAGGLAHNFNNLLMSIIGNASLILLDLNPDHPHYKNLKNIEKSVKSGSQVTRQLLGYARE
ncbi:MAG: PAS domain S-box protein, partial [Deltaproteobacteria bacterium]|nr:PAS domain S-box protein [Deltaproteobacteria bacterium]